MTAIGGHKWIINEKDKRLKTSMTPMEITFMLTRLPMKFLSTLINAQLLRDGLAHSQNGSYFLVILLTRAMVKDAKYTHITGRIGKAGHTPSLLFLPL